MSGTPLSNLNNIYVQSMIPEDQKNMNTQLCSTGRHFTAATQTINNSCSKLNETDETESSQEAWPARESIELLLKTRLGYTYI